jgi:hypothetical protein
MNLAGKCCPILKKIILTSIDRYRMQYTLSTFSSCCELHIHTFYERPSPRTDRRERTCPIRTEQKYPAARLSIFDMLKNMKSKNNNNNDNNNE